MRLSPTAHQGFAWENVLSPEARAEWEGWKQARQEQQQQQQSQPSVEEEEKGEGQHDTIGLIVRDARGNLAAGGFVEFS